MSKLKFKIGDEVVNKYGDVLVLIEYRNYNDITILFKEYNITKNTSCQYFKNGCKLICEYSKGYSGVGFIGVGKYNIYQEEGRTMNKCARTWSDMLRRCYDVEYKEKHPSYKDVYCCDEWHNFQNFAKWYYDNFYDIDEQLCLDKDILNKNNKIYSPNSCILIPQTINKLIEKRDRDRGDYPLGVYLSKSNNGFVAQCSTPLTNKKNTRYIGTFNTIKEAFNSYKKVKEEYIKEVADLYKDKIPQKLYEAMYNYEVEITD